MSAKVLLKARPTRAQLADRLAEPWPDGLELYLDADDIQDDAAMRDVLDRLSRERLPRDFRFIVEGPVGSLDGQFFHVGRNSPADAEVVRRVVAMGQQLGADAVNLHVIAPEDESSLNPARRAQLMQSCIPLLEEFVQATLQAGMVPTIENMPAVLRMRHGGFYFSAIGMAPEDLACLMEQLPGLRLCLDVSHAQLVVNAQQGWGEGAERWPRLRAFLGAFAPLAGVDDFVERLQPWLYSAHISNATGVTGEGLPYATGDLQLDSLIQKLDGLAQYIVTETLEPDPNHARLMRDAQQRIARAIGGARV